jgi:hypothetical protein
MYVGISVSFHSSLLTNLKLSSAVSFFKSKNDPAPYSKGLPLPSGFVVSVAKEFTVAQSFVKLTDPVFFISTLYSAADVPGTMSSHSRASGVTVISDNKETFTEMRTVSLVAALVEGVDKNDKTVIANIAKKRIAVSFILNFIQPTK